LRGGAGASYRRNAEVLRLTMILGIGDAARRLLAISAKVLRKGRAFRTLETKAAEVLLRLVAGNEVLKRMDHDVSTKLRVLNSSRARKSRVTCSSQPRHPLCSEAATTIITTLFGIAMVQY
jgi:hypothetical protein